jgi:hypothetical protein
MSNAETNIETIAGRRALEALRAGVPSRDVVRLLPPLQARAIRAFEGLLEETELAWTEHGKHPHGVLLSGGYGTGKSHLLEYAKHLALESNFIVSRVVLNKETPLCDLEKLYRACVENAETPHRSGSALAAIAEDFKPEKMPHWLDLFRWAHQEENIDPRFGALLFVFEKSGMLDEEVREKVLAEWMGYPMKVSDLRSALRQCGESGYSVSRPAKGQTHQRFEFMSRFFRSAGYKGWVILLDETEWVARYSLKQRGHAYAHLAQLAGYMKSHEIKGLAAVFTITDDYGSQVIRGGDGVKVPAKMESVDDPKTEAAVVGMNLIETKITILHAPSPEQVKQTYTQVKALYQAAYPKAGEPSDIPNALEYAASTRMRQYVRAWVNIWDLRRLYGHDINIQDMVTEGLNVTLTEDTDLQETAEEKEAPQIFEE